MCICWFDLVSSLWWRDDGVADGMFTASLSENMYIESISPHLLLVNFSSPLVLLS